MFTCLPMFMNLSFRLNFFPILTLKKNIMLTNEKQRNPFKWDILGSTYYWKIYLDKSHPNNSNNVEFLKGYSKQEKQNEGQDKIHLLKSKILNLYKNGYFKRIERIEIFQRLGEIINTKEDAKIIILYPKGHDINPRYMAHVMQNFNPFLLDFYNRIENNLSMDEIIKLKRKPISQDDYLNVKIQKIYSLQQLYSYGARLLVNGHPQGAVTKFINDYKELKKW